MLERNVLIRLCRARDLLREAFEPPLTIEEIASGAGMSPWHFIRRFESVFGVTPHQFRIGARIDQAKYLLATSDHSVTDVCLDVGFTSLGSFSDLFARRVGDAPSSYRRQVRSLMPIPGVLPHALRPGCFSLMAGTEGLAIFEKHTAGILSDSGTVSAASGAALGQS